MTQASRPADLGVEEEIDLSRWGRLIFGRWWIVVAGLTAGALIGLLVGASTSYRASLLIQPAQVFGPTGEPVLNYQASAQAIQTIVTSATAFAAAGKAAHVSPTSLRGRVSVQGVSTGASSSSAARGATIFEIVVLLPNRDQAASADNALGAFLIRQTTSRYERRSIELYRTKIKEDQAQIDQLTRRIKTLNHLLATRRLALIDRVLVVSEASDFEQRVGSIFDDLSSAQSQLILARDLGRAKLVGGPATVGGSRARTRSTSILVGAVIGFLLGLLAAVYLERRRPGRSQISGPRGAHGS